MLLDFANAFNHVDRNLVIFSTSKSYTELVNFTWEHYRLEPRVVTNKGHKIPLFIGTQQGCRLSKPLLALLTEYLPALLDNIDGLQKPLFYVDDTAPVGTPKSLIVTALIKNQCRKETDLMLKLKKCGL